MRGFRSRALAAACLAALGAPLGACAGAPSYETRTSRDAYADFLIGRVANLRDDHRAAQERFFDALATNAPTEELIDGALTAALANGDARRARQAARLAEEHGLDVAAARLVRAADALGTQRWGRVQSELGGLHGDGVEELSSRMLGMWARTGAGDAQSAADDIAAINAPQPFAGMFDYQRALAFDYARRDEAAATTYAAARASAVWAAPAVVREIDLLRRMGRGGEVRALFADQAGRIRDPGVARATEEIEAGRSGAPNRLTPARGAAIGFYTLAGLLIEQQEPGRALTLLTLSLMLDPALDSSRLMAADAHRQLGRLDEARALLAGVADSSPYAEAARASAAWTLRAENRNDEALAAARANGESGGRFARTNLADLYRSLERWSEAEAAYTGLIDDLGTAGEADWSLYFSRGAARERLGDWPGAQADLQRALALSPDHPEVLNYLGYAWVDRGENVEEGLALILRAVAQRPSAGHIVDSLGWAYYRLGDFDLALRHLERAVELEPADPTLNDHLGDALWAAGRRVEARYQWSRARTLQPSDSERAAIDRKLADGLPPAPAPPSSAAR